MISHEEILKKTTEKFDKIKMKLFVGSIGLLYFVQFVSFFGIFYINPSHIDILANFIHIFICLFLLYRFNPFRKPIFTEFDQKIIFSTAILLLLNLGFAEFFKQKFLENVNHIKTNLGY